MDSLEGSKPLGLIYRRRKARGRMKLIVMGTLAVIFAAIGLDIWILGVPESTKDWGGFGSRSALFVSPLIALASLMGVWVIRKKEHERANSEAYSRHAILCLERAYNVITNNGEREGPEKHRLEWLTCARWLVVSNRLATKIAVPIVREIFGDEQEYWRVQFHDFFKPHDLYGFASSVDNFREIRPGDGDSLEPKSVTAIYKFIEWTKSRPDPIDDQQQYSDDEVSQMHSHKRGIKAYFEGP